MLNKRANGILLASLALASVSGLASGATLYSTGWEASPASPAWNVGNISGQNGWTNFNNAAGHQVINGGAVTPAAGSRMHQSGSSAAGSVSRFTYVDLSSLFAARPVGENTIEASLDFYLPSTNTSSTSAHGLVAYNPAADYVFAGFYVIPSTGELIYTATSLDFDVDTGVTVADDTWTNIKLGIDFAAGVAGIQIGSEFVALSNFDPLAQPTLGDVDLYNVTSGGNVAASVIFTDNYLIASSTQAVPEPATAGALIGLAAVALRRRGR